MDNCSTQQIYTDRIQQSVDYISEHLSEKIQLDKLASIACFSPFHFHRIFTAFAGETPRSYIERLKLESAANRLCDIPQKSISEIAGDVGFESGATFSRLFKKQYNISPTEFRKEKNKDIYFLRQSNKERLKPLSETSFSLIEIKILPPARLIYTQTMQGYSSGTVKAWQKLKSYATKHHLIQKDTLFLGIPFDNPGITPAEKCRYRAGLTVPENAEIDRTENIKQMKLSRGKYVIFHFKGTSDSIFRAFDFIYGKWLPLNGYIPDEKPQIEFYGPDFLLNFNTKNYNEYGNVQIAMPIVKLP